ncbi:MAG: RagB/SusD family nutrient uptake outer membrane protein [Chitinophagaceae bacterium]
MKKIFYIVILSLGIGLVFTSCKKNLLDLAPKDQISDPEFWKSTQDMELYINGLYSVLPGWLTSGSGGNPLLDAGTDMAISVGLWLPTKNRLDGAINVPSSGGGWTWTNVRNVNYFLENASRVPDGGLKDHYIGEAYFFRAWNYFTLLRQFGDLPIITKTLSAGDQDVLFGSRSSKTDVVNFIISDLDMAISKLKKKNEVPAQRISRDIAYLLESRIALYEGTWEKYHQNDVFKGKTNGDAFLNKAAQAAKAVIDGGTYSLSAGDPNQVYYNIFNQINLGSNPEILLWRSYSTAQGDQFTNQLWNWPHGSGYTQEMVRMYLCKDGLPIGLSPLYQGENDIRNVIANRDPRLVQSVMNPGDPVTINLKNDTTKFTLPVLGGAQNDPTGYESQKFRRPQLDPATGTYSGELAYIIFRYAEALLNYAEAKAELGQLTQTDVDISINKLRARVGMPNFILASIPVDPAWPDYGYTLPNYLYEIRREREVELLTEGFRLDDLMRWRADKLFAGKRPKGAYYSAELKAAYPNLTVDANNFLDPYKTALTGANGGWGFNPAKHYLLPIPTNELTLNPEVKQNPGW